MQIRSYIACEVAKRLKGFWKKKYSLCHLQIAIHKQYIIN